MFASLAAAGLLSVSLAAAPLNESNQDIVDTAVAAGSFNTLAAALTEAGLIDALKGDGPFTVFAPTDAAFAALPAGTVETLLLPENRARLTAILTYHVVPGRVGSRKVVDLTGALTLNGQRLGITVDHGTVRIDDATVQTVDIDCTNGVIHVIDKVLLPSADNLVETAVKAGRFGTLVAAVKAAGLVETLVGEGPFTVLAPTDAAFAALPAGTVESLLLPRNRDKLTRILTYHVIPGRVYAADALATLEFTTVESSPVRFATLGERVMVGTAGVVATDIDATNGVIHVIDAVIMPPKGDDMARAVNALIDEAITLGAPMFNNGQPAACAAVYAIAAQGLMTLPGDGLPAAANERMRRALTEADAEHDHRQRAWILRGALDDVRAMPLATMMMPLPAPRMETSSSKTSSCSQETKSSCAASDSHSL